MSELEMSRKLFYIKKKFTTDSNLRDEVEKYEQATGYRLSRRDTSSRDVPVDDPFQFNYVVYNCKKSGVPKSKGKGLRNRTSQKTSCLFTLRAKYQRVKDKEDQRVKDKGDQQVKDKEDQQVKDKEDDKASSEFLEITLLNLIHNHPPSYDPNPEYMNEQPLFTAELNESETEILLDDTNNISNEMNAITLTNTKEKIANESLTTQNQECVSENANTKRDINNDALKYKTHEKKEKEHENVRENDQNENGIFEEDKSQHDKRHLEREDNSDNVETLPDTMERVPDTVETVQDTVETVQDTVETLRNNVKTMKTVEKVKKVAQNVEVKKTRGRPKGAVKSAIGLPLKNELVPFTNLSDKGKLKKILEWINLPSDAIKVVLDGESELPYSILEEKITNLCDSFLADDIDLNLRVFRG